MKPIWKSFLMMSRQIIKDEMLLLLLIAPVLAAFFFHYAIPYFDLILSELFHVETVFQPYYRLLDLFLGILPSYLFAFVIAMTLLEDYDSHMIGHLVVTPLKKLGYLLSKVLFPILIAWFISIVLMQLFSLDTWKMEEIFLISGLMTFSSFMIVLIIFSYSSNKVEGMAIAKISGMVLIGLFIPFFIPSSNQYIFAILPSFWIAKISLSFHISDLLFGLASTVIWTLFFIQRFLRKLSHSS